MTKELLQQALTEARAEAIEVFTSNSGIAAETKDAIEYMHSLLNVYFDKQALAQQETNPWQDAVIDQLVVHHIYQSAHDTDPRLALHHLLCMSNQIALDPRVSSDAQALIDRGRREAQQEQPALSDEDFYKIVRPFYGTDEACKMALPMSIDEFRSIEAHCRGGVDHG